MKNLPFKDQINQLRKERDNYKFGANLFLGTTLFFVVVSAFLTCLLIF